MAIDGIFFEDNRLTTTTAIQGKDTSELGMNDFLNLLVAQMTNQDMLNPTSDTDFIAQMAQFASLQGIQTLQEYTLSSYAASYAGKYVTIAEQNATGGLDTITGKVESVTFYDGQPKVQVNGKTYDVYKIMEVGDSATTGSLADAAKYLGMKVTVSKKGEFGETQEVTGIVTGVTMTDNKPMVIVGGIEFPVSSIISANVVESTGGGSGESPGNNEEGES